jgi:predicted GNAT superfamily acetyltransferase
MPDYRFLNDSDFNSLHNCFLEAFSDYSVNMQMTEEQYRARLVHNGVRLDSSVGAFEANEMIGFTINGIGTWQEKQTVYDAGTGVVPQYRGKGVAKDLFNFMRR